jgi:threonine dehydrogenase-like Zn-dependent dehydrogenase
MIALYFDGRELRLAREYPFNRLDDAVVRVVYAGICGTDLEILRGYAGFSGVPGHEFVGVVVEAGDRFLVGRRVVGEINVGCGVCGMCVRGLERHCPNRTVLGIKGRDGAFAEYLSLPSRNLHIVPDNVDDAEAVFTEPLAAAYEILEQVKVDPSWRVAVVGDGRLANLIAQVLSTVVDRLRVFGKHERKVGLLRELGIDAVVEVESRDLNSYDMVVEATGSLTGYARAVELVKPRGLVVLKSTVAARHEINMAPLVVNEVTLIGSRCGPFKPALKALSKGIVKVSKLVDAIYGFEEYREAFEKAEEPATLKVLLKPLNKR